MPAYEGVREYLQRLSFVLIRIVLGFKTHLFRFRNNRSKDLTFPINNISSFIITPVGLALLDGITAEGLGDSKTPSFFGSVFFSQKCRFCCHALAGGRKKSP